ncbi:MAG: hypothetical protein PXY39_06515 [archaeon]|nr:hypothetical protein [archaeon]
MKIGAFHLLIAVSAIAVFLRLVVIPFFGNGLHGNPVDVYYVDREAAKLILQYQNPYLFSNYTNYLGKVVTFAYLPVIPAYFAPFVFIGSDIRYGSIIADVVITIAMYFIARSTLGGTHTKPWIRFSGSIAYAILPTSIYLTSVSGTNMMIGPMFLIVALAALLQEKWLVAGIFLGLALAANQFIILTFPLIAIYSLRNHNLKTILVSILVASAIILPFMLYSPSKFLYDVLLFQLERPMQKNGIWSLYYLVYAISGFKMGTYLRLAIFLVPAGIVSILFSTTKKNVLIGTAIVSALATFVLPLDGFWNYFLLPMIIICALIPSILSYGYVKRFVLLKEINTSSRPENIGSPRFTDKQ